MAVKSEERWCIHERFEAQVARTPLAIAAVLDEAAITYDVLNRKANRVAHRLSRLGAGPEVPVVVRGGETANAWAGCMPTPTGGKTSDGKERGKRYPKK